MAETWTPIETTTTTTTLQPNDAIASSSSMNSFFLLLIPLALLAAVIYVFSHQATATTRSTAPPLVAPSFPAYGALPAYVPLDASNPAKTTPAQSALSSSPSASAAVRGGLTTDPGIAQYTTTVNPACAPGTPYYPACTFTNPRSYDYNPNPMCYKGSQYYPLCLTTSTHTSASWR